MKNTLWFLLITSSFLTFSYDRLYAQEEIATAGILNWTGKQILHDADGILDKRISQLNEVANGQVNRLTTNLSVLSAGARINLKDVLDKPLNKLDDQQRAIFIAIRQLFCFCCHQNVPRVSKFHRVPNEVDDTLSEPGSVTQNHVNVWTQV